MSRRPIPAKPIIDGPFSFDDDGFNIDGITRVGGPSLSEMLFPEKISGIRAQKRARDRAETTITFPWLVAHLTFYDITFEPEDTVAELTELLADNVKNGRCNKLPSRVRAIASDLEQLFKTVNPTSPQPQSKLHKPAAGTQHNASLTLDDKDKKALRKLNPVDLANYAPRLFLAKYFQDQDGNPDPSRSPSPILLQGLSDRLALQQSADNIPGLKTESGGEGEFRVLAIGWSRAAIFDKTERISACQARLQDELSPYWQDCLRKHYTLIKSLPILSKPKRLAIESAQGTYALECRGVTDSWDLHDGDPKLRITFSDTDGWIGIFHIGVIYGVMRLDTNRKALLARCKATEKSEIRENVYDEFDEDEDDEIKRKEREEVISEEEDVFSDLSTTETWKEDTVSDISSNEPQEEIYESDSDGLIVLASRKRKRALVEAREIEARRKSSIKRLKPSASTVNDRIYFKWRGREHGEGDNASDSSKKNTGYLQFTDAHCTKFESTISNDLIGRNVYFQGFKISTDGGAVTNTYREYSEHAQNGWF